MSVQKFPFLRLLACAAPLFLPACAYVNEGQIQKIEVQTPGTENTICYMFVEGFRYKLRPPQTVSVSKSDQDLVLECQAPGNRERKLVIRPVEDDNYTLANTPSLGFGAAWDSLSKSIYNYPRVIVVDFSTAPVTPNAMPAHENPKLIPPGSHDLEEFLPGTPVMNADRHEQPTELKRREKPAPAAPRAYKENFLQEGSGQGDKGSLKKASPLPATGAYGPPASGKPVPLYPGQ